MAGRDPHGVELGNLKILNVVESIAAATESDFSFKAPSGGVLELREATYHMKRVPPLSGSVNGYESEDIKIKALYVTKQGASERVNLLTGTPNLKEFAGDGKLSKLFTVVETLENNEDIIITVRNDDSVTVRVSITLHVAIFPRARRIAAQGGAGVQGE